MMKAIRTHDFGAVWHCYLNNIFQYLNNNNTSDMYFYNPQIYISIILKTE